MKQMHTFFFLATVIALFLSCSKPSGYDNGNGTVLGTKTIDGIEWVYRKHYQTVIIGNWIAEESMMIHEKHSKASPISEELGFEQLVSVSRIATAYYNDSYEIWLRVSTDDTPSGWLFLDSGSTDTAPYNDPYYNNRWEIIDTVGFFNPLTVCRMNGDTVSAWGKAELRDKPGRGGDVTETVTSPSGQINFSVLAMCTTPVTIDDITDYWLLVSYEGKQGWIFGGETDVERGGPKYYTPMTIIESHLN